MPSTPHLYRYRKLTESDAIRLIIVQPALDFKDLIQCRIIHTSLTECEENIVDHYTAISYVWGDPEDTRKILVDNDKFLNITTTLDSALRHIRPWNKSIRLWADAVSINQADVEERNSQVRQMGAIYGCALHTIIYFGPSTPDVELFLETLRISSANLRKGSSGTSSLGLSLSDLSREFKASALIYLLELPWLTRIWVLQEMVFSQNPWIQCGGARARWEDFCDFVRKAERPVLPAPRAPLPIRKSFIDVGPQNHSSTTSIHPPEGKHSRGWELLEKMSKFRLAFYDQTSWLSYGHGLLLEMLKSRRGLGVTDPKDMLFAHTNVARTAEVQEKYRYLIDVDYNRSCPEVYERVAIYFMRQLNDFSILSAVEDVELRSRRRDIMSWAPDWTCAMPSAPWVELRFSLHQERFNAGTWSDARSWSYSSGSLSTLRCGHLERRWLRQFNKTLTGLNQLNPTRTWLPSTFCCIGVEIARIGVMSGVLNWPLPYFDIEKFLNQQMSVTLVLQYNILLWLERYSQAVTRFTKLHRYSKWGLRIGTCSRVTT